MKVTKEIKFYVGLKTQYGLRLNADDVIEQVVAPTLAAVGFDGFSVTQAAGYWKGAREECLVVSLCADDDNLPDVETIAAHIARATYQECVLWTITSLHGGFAG